MELAFWNGKGGLPGPNSYWTPAVFLGFSGVLTDKSRCSDLPKKPQL
jgi:hypothetical protein